jgi:hypothetical protein
MTTTASSNISTTSQGVVLLAFGKPIYGQSAYILAKSIKHFNQDIKIALLTDGLAVPPDYSPFDELINVPVSDYRNRNGGFEPGRAKLLIYDKLPYDYNLFIDADSIALKDIAPLFDEMIATGKPYLTHVVGKHKIHQGNNFAEMQWAWANDIWNRYQLAEDDTLYAINSSIVFIKKSKFTQSLYNVAETLLTDYPTPTKALRRQWGGTQPDELYMNISLAKHKYDASFKPVMYFAMKKQDKIEDVIASNYLLSYYGGINFTYSYYTDWIQKFINKDLKLDISLNNIIRQKHANKK